MLAVLPWGARYRGSVAGGGVVGGVAGEVVGARIRGNYLS